MSPHGCGLWASNGLIVTFRPEFAAPWAGRPHVTSLGLNRLAPRQREEMIAGITGGRALPDEIAAQIVDRTDGVPLFVEELTKAVVESGMLTDIGDRYTATGPMPALAIPASLQASLLARLDRLAPVREVAQIGAALGRQFSHELIAAVASMPSGELDNALAQLVGAELIYRRGIPPDAEYTFKHALVQDAAYSTLLRSRRLQLHAHIAATLEDRFPEIVAAQPALLAHHCEEGALTEKAIDYWLAAGRQAWGRSMLAEAVALLRRGLALVPSLPDSDRRGEREFDLQIALGQALSAFQSRSAPEAGEAYARAQQLAVTVNRPRDLLLALSGQWVYYWVQADLDRAMQVARVVRDFDESGGDVATLQTGCHMRGSIHWNCGEFLEARADLEQSLALFDPSLRPFLTQLSYDPLVCLLANSSLLLVCMGHLDQALSRVHRALQEARQLSRPDAVAMATAHAWLVGWCIRSNPESLLQDADTHLAFAAEHGLGLQQALGRIYRGWSLAALGHADEGLTALGTGLAGLDETGAFIWRPLLLTVFADACRIAGKLPAALGHLTEAQRLTDETAERWTAAGTLRLRGEVLLAMDDPAAAEASYREALALAQQQSANLWELRAAMSFARLWRDQGKRSEACDLLGPIYDWFSEGLGAPVLQEAKALLEGLSEGGLPPGPRN
jgi:tetratricopeptide (TPR) repeat protein